MWLYAVHNYNCPIASESDAYKNSKNESFKTCTIPSLLMKQAHALSSTEVKSNTKPKWNNKINTTVQITDQFEE